MPLKTLLALWLGKITQLASKPFPKFGGFAAPGLLALNIDPNFVKNLGKQIPTHIMVSGTNGKTTTTRMVSQILKKEGINIINNRTGSNLLRGIASALIAQSSTTGKLMPRIALWEVDEAALLPLVRQIKPQILVLTNLFRDQLDRYGEIDAIAHKWQKVIKDLPEKSTFVTNTDDPTLSSLAKQFKNSISFGLSSKIVLKKTPDHASDASFCPKCLRPLKYTSVSYSHVGVFKPCPCGFTQAKKVAVVTQIYPKNEGLEFDLKISHKKYSLNLPLKGTFNIYNALAALSVAFRLKLSLERAVKTLSNFKAAFGRSEEIKVNDKILKLLLIKNPTGFNQVINTLVNQSVPLRPANQRGFVGSSKKVTLLIVINDKIADGRDVSWLWDANLEKLKSHVKKIIVSGIRAHDMSLRIKYAGFDLKKIDVQKNLEQAIARLLEENIQNLFILPTYTAMLEIREVLRKKGLASSSWED